LKLDGSGLPEVRLIYTYTKLRAPSLIIFLSLNLGHMLSKIILCNIPVSLYSKQSSSGD